MKKLICILLSILFCLTIAACEDKQEPTPQNPSQNEETKKDETESEEKEDEGTTPEEEENKGGGNVVTPIQPGGNFNGGGY